MAKRQYPEFQVQCSYVSMMRTYYPDVLMFAIPNGGKRGVRDGKRFKAMGVLSGVYDIFVSEPNGVYSGFYVEFKAPGRSSGTSEMQNDFKDRAEERGYMTAVFDDAVLALKATEEYLGIPRDARISARIHPQ
jgi:hypothetical protein